MSPSSETTPLLRDSAPKSVDEEAAAPVTDIPEPTTAALLAIVLPMALGVFLSALDGTIVVSSYAAIGSELKQLQNTSWIATSYLLTLTAFQPLYGKLSDVFGRKACLLTAYVLFAIGSLACGLARTMEELILSRAFAGIGGAGLTTVVSIVLSDVIPLRKRGTWQGVLNLVFASGSALGAPLGGLLADSVGWRYSFLIQVPAVMLAFVCVSFALHLPTSDTSYFSSKIRRIDFLGSATLLVLVFSLLFGLDRGGNVAWGEKWTLVALCTFVASTVVFGIVEMRIAREPLAPKRIIANSSLIAAYLVNFFGMASGMGYMYYVSLYFQAVKGISPHGAGLRLLPPIVGGVIGSLAGGLIMQSTGKFKRLTVGAYFALAVGCAIATLAAGVVGYSYTIIAIGLTILSIGNGLGITSTLIAIIANAGLADQAIATAVSYLFRSLGSVIGVAAGGTLIQVMLRYHLRQSIAGQDAEEIIRNVRESLSYIDGLAPELQQIIRAAYERSIQATLWLATGFAVCALIASFSIREKALTR